MCKLEILFHHHQLQTYIEIINYNVKYITRY